jgi:protein O-mannosyl-transferase
MTQPPDPTTPPSTPLDSGPSSTRDTGLGTRDDSTSSTSGATLDAGRRTLDVAFLSPPQTRNPKPGTRIVLYLLVAIAALLAHFPVIYNQFVSFDDKDYIYNNQMVEHGLTPTTIKWALTEHVVANWHPVTMLSHLVDGTLFGLNPAGHHAMSLLLHALNAVLLALVLVRFTGSFYRSIAVAMIFAVHPIHVESVAWASDRKDMLSLGFAMLTLLAYKNWLDLRTPARYALILVAYLLALLSKPTVITLPALMLLLDFWPLNRATPSQPGFKPAVQAYLKLLPKLILEKLPILILTVAGSIAVFLIQRGASAVVDAAGLPITARLFNALFSYIRYVGKLLLPIDLTIMYPHPTWWPPAYIILSAIALVLITGVLIYLANKYDKRYLPVGWLWFLGVMVPMIGIVQVGQQALADRYAYITFPGLYILIVWSIADLLSRRKASPHAAGLLLAAAVVPLAILANLQARIWINSETLFTHAIAVTGPNPFAQCSLANELVRQKRFEESLPHFQETIRIEPTYSDAWGNMGTALWSLGKTDEAEKAYEKALSLNVNLIEPRINIARIYMQQHKDAQAEAVFVQLAKEKPDVPETYFFMGQLRARQNNLPQALAFYDQAIARKPDYADAYNSRGITKARLGNIPGAHEDFTRAVNLDPANPTAHENLQRATQILQQKP